MTRFVWLMMPLALAACVPRQTAPGTASASAGPPNPAVCRIGPDGGRPMTDRGIGGTGAPEVQTADRGIGGTGIIGVITGFASVCVAGKEVALPDTVAARMDGRPTGLDALRAGQFVAMEATGPADSLQAEQITVRHEVIGPVEAAGPGTMTVAGQPVVLEGAIGSGISAGPGDWVAVSGLREPDGVILATRVDPVPPGPVLVRGELVRIAGTAQIGGLTVLLPEGSDAPAGFPVTVTGRMNGAVLVADSVVLDTVADRPSDYFGPSVTSFVVESYVAVVAGGYLVNRDFVAGSGFGTVGSRGRGIATFSRRSQGGLVATGLLSGAATLGGPTAPFGRFTPAPVPHGGFGGGRGIDRSSGLDRDGALSRDRPGFPRRDFPGQNGPNGASAPGGFQGPGGFSGPGGGGSGSFGPR
jgi:hypothetical protein